MPSSRFKRCTNLVKAGFGAVLVSVSVMAGAGATAHADLLDGMAGDPNGAAQYWAPQSIADDCSLMSTADVVGQITGNRPSEEEIVALATSTPSISHAPGPIYTLPEPNGPKPGEGTWLRDVPVLLEHYGIGSAYTNDVVATEGGLPTGIPALVDDLYAGKKIIVSVNWETLRDQPGDRTRHNHAVVVTGVDTRAGIVHLNDSAFDGPNEQVSIPTFDESWRTSDHGMVVAG